MTDARGIFVPTSGRAYEAACEAIRCRADALNISRANIDAVAGLPERNAAKLLSPVPDKRMMAETMLRILDAIEFDVVLVPRPGAEARIAELFGERAKAHVRTTNPRSALRIRNKARREKLFTDPNYFKKLGRSGGRATAKGMTAKERSRSAAKAARAGWRKRKAQRRATRCAPGFDRVQQRGEAQHGYRKI